MPEIEGHFNISSKQQQKVVYKIKNSKLFYLKQIIILGYFVLGVKMLNATNLEDFAMHYP